MSRRGGRTTKVPAWKKALQEKAEAEAGGKSRASTYQLETEEAVFDEVTDKEYNRIVAERRDKEDFVVEDDDGGYLDDGEEHYFDGDEEAAAAGEDAAAAEAAEASKKRGRGASKAEKEAAKGTKKVSQMFWEMRGKGGKAGSKALGGAGGRKGLLGSKKRKQQQQQQQGRHAVAIDDVDLDAEFDDLDSSLDLSAAAAGGSSASKRPSLAAGRLGMGSRLARSGGEQGGGGDDDDDADEAPFGDMGGDDHGDHGDHGDDTGDAAPLSGSKRKAGGEGGEGGEGAGETAEAAEAAEKKRKSRSRLFAKASNRRQESAAARDAEKRAMEEAAAAAAVAAAGPQGAASERDGKGWWNVGEAEEQAADKAATAAAAEVAAVGLGGAVVSGEGGLPLHEGFMEKKKSDEDEDEDEDEDGDEGSNSKSKSSKQAADGKGEKYQYLKMFWLDAYQDPRSSKGKIYLVGKVFDEAKKQFVSCCVKVSGLERNLYFLPRGQTAGDGGDGNGGDGGGGEPDMMAVYTEVAALLQREVIPRGHHFKCKPVKRDYAFEVAGVPRREATYLKVVYSSAFPALDSDTTGKTFSRVFGTHTKDVENFILKRDLMGPCWIEVRMPRANNPGAGGSTTQFSWCKLEAEVDSPKQIVKLAAKPGAPLPPAPPLTVMNLSLKTFVNQRSHAHEVVAVAAVVHKAVKADGKTPQDELRNTQHFTVVRGLGSGTGADIPHEFRGWAKSSNRQSWLTVAGNERALLSCFLAKVHKFDPDFIVGHNLHGFLLDVLMSRFSAHKVAHWSKLGRMRRSQLPSGAGGGSGGQKSGTTGRGAFDFFDMAPGRLLCDTYLTARELIRENNYALTHLAKVHLETERKDIDPLDVPRYFRSCKDLVRLLGHTHQEATLVFSLLTKLEMIPLSKQLTNLGGNLWARTLKGGRAERIEYLLLHEFHRRKYIKPDKALRKGAFDKKSGKGKGGAGGKDEAAKKKPVRGKPAYSGGLVLEPKKGLYDKYVLLLDFNSLYPSIIQEYNLCFTTVERQLIEAPGSGAMGAAGGGKGHGGKTSTLGGGGGGGDDDDDDMGGAAAGAAGEDEAKKDGGFDDFAMPALPSKEAQATEGVLPQLIRILVQRRRQVKSMMKSERNDEVKGQLEIRQKALKLTANSMYGCLGFSGSRFYAKPIAALVTSQGREILQRTVDMATAMGLDVIYGDTDSIMIHTGSDQLPKVYEIGNKVKREVNKLYTKLEIEIDGIYKTMLLLKKKKYAALMINEEGITDPKNPKFTVKETKGLDLVRRDWCELSKDVGNYVLDRILSGQDTETVVNQIHQHLSDVAQRMRAGQIPLAKYVITKGLNKRPQHYPDTKGQPHLQVALRMVAEGKPVNVGDHIPYVITAKNAEADDAKDGGAAKAAGGKAASSGKASFADRAYHPEEVARSQRALARSKKAAVAKAAAAKDGGDDDDDDDDDAAAAAAAAAADGGADNDEQDDLAAGSPLQIDVEWCVIAG